MHNIKNDINKILEDFPVPLDVRKQISEGLQQMIIKFFDEAKAFIHMDIGFFSLGYILTFSMAEVRYHGDECQEVDVQKMIDNLANEENQ